MTGHFLYHCGWNTTFNDPTGCSGLVCWGEGLTSKRTRVRQLPFTLERCICVVNSPSAPVTSKVQPSPNQCAFNSASRQLNRGQSNKTLHFTAQ